MKIVKKPKAIMYDKGKLYFQKGTERNIFFILTMLMMVFGLYFKLFL